MNNNRYTVRTRESRQNLSEGYEYVEEATLFVKTIEIEDLAKGDYESGRYEIYDTKLKTVMSL